MAAAAAAAAAAGEQRTFESALAATLEDLELSTEVILKATVHCVRISPI